VRIIAGEFRRRKLLSSPGMTTRPITDRVKESLFELIEGHLVDRKVADVFAGTGSLGLEALSRGATSAVFIESDRRAFGLLRQNVATLGIEERALCWRTDALWSSFHPKGVDAFLPFDVVFFDPPYRMAQELAPGTPLFQALARLARDTVTARDARLYFRAPEEAPLRLPESWTRETSYSISSMEIHVYRKQAATESAEGKSLPADAEGTGDSPE
jgi:16S rRNA (guanine966-N2)-methyltransferase